MKDGKLEIVFENLKDKSRLKNTYLTGIHPLAHSKSEKKSNILQVPAWLETPQNLIERKLIFLELMKH